MKHLKKIKNSITAFISVIILMAVLQSCTKTQQMPGSFNVAAAQPVTSAAIAKSGPVSVCYVEVNSNSILDPGKYTLASTGANVFDIAIIFAANINYNTSTGKAYLYNNPQVSNTLKNASTQIRPLQNQGIKVMLSILGNHQGAGICNLTSKSAATAFAQQLTDTVNYYGLDGIDFDDEYADYGTNNTGQPNDSSFVLLVSSLRTLMPDKIISFYYYGPAASRLSYNGTTVGSKVNYSWNAFYGTFQVPNVPGLTKSLLSPAAVDLQSTSSSTAASLATQTINGGYGVYLTYNISDAEMTGYISSFTNTLYGSSAVYNPNGGAGMPSTPSPVVSGSVYSLVSAVNRTSVLDVTGSGIADGTKAELWSNNGGTNNQKWKITDVGNGYYKIQPQNAPAKALDVANSGTANGTQVQIYADNGTNAQKWKITSAGSGYYYLTPAIAPASNLDVYSGATANGTKIEIWSANTGNAQKWKFVLQ